MNITESIVVVGTVSEQAISIKKGGKRSRPGSSKKKLGKGGGGGGKPK